MVQLCSSFLAMPGNVAQPGRRLHLWAALSAAFPSTLKGKEERSKASSRGASALHVCATWQCLVSWQRNAPVRDAAARHPCIPKFERGAQPGEQLHGAAEIPVDLAMWQCKAPW